MAWFKLAQFRDFVGEPVPTKKYKNLIKILQRLNRIDPSLAPEEVRTTLNTFLRPGNPYANKPAPATVDEVGRARGKGKRKESSAVVYLVEGEGEVLVNGKSLIDVFPRLHDRESALWPLRCTQRLDKYNVWATVRGGGVTGQAEAITLAVARALLVHEPALKPAMRKCKLYPISCWDDLQVVYLLAGSCHGDGYTCSHCYRFSLLTSVLFYSWCYHGRCSSRGKKEARSSESQKDAHLGQEMNDIIASCFLPYLYYSNSAGIFAKNLSLYLSHRIIMSRRQFDFTGILDNEPNNKSFDVSIIGHFLLGSESSNMSV
jgi:small subunit ribosomal protein S9